MVVGVRVEAGEMNLYSPESVDTCASGYHVELLKSRLSDFILKKWCLTDNLTQPLSKVVNYDRLSQAGCQNREAWHLVT